LLLNHCYAPSLLDKKVITEMKKKSVKTLYYIFIYGCTSILFQKVAMRALGFDVKKADVLKILKDYDREATGKITFEDFNEVGMCLIVYL